MRADGETQFFAWYRSGERFLNGRIEKSSSPWLQASVIVGADTHDRRTLQIA